MSKTSAIQASDRRGHKSKILGLDVIQRSANHIVRRLIWLTALTTCLVLAAVHGASLMQRYRSYPTRVQLDVANRQGIALPAVTVCPLDRFDVNRLERLWRHTIGHDAHAEAPHAADQYYQLADVLPVQELWNKIAYTDAQTLFPVCYLGRGRDCQSEGTFQAVWTPSGTCFTYSSELSTLSGHFNGLYARLSIGHELNEFIKSSGWKVTVHQVGVSAWLTSSRQYAEMTTHYRPFANGTVGGGTVKSQHMNIRLTPKEFNRIDHPRQPCSSDAWSRADCEIECFQRIVTSITNCRLPYMTDGRVAYCNTSSSVRRTEELVAQLITETRSQLKCGCVEACSKVVYMYESESHTVPTAYGRIKIFYDTSLWVTVNEVFLYTWVKLLCDAGNILCLLLGASVLTFFEIAEYIVNQLMALRHSFK
ncbi:acid-sensing ion channel 2-like [Daphnia carinata]|uniref:acid-sensing ion channel 2-like n=1 Tax=Daphnia carinata TaxID=120202 RepID=UPI00257C509F|nr:acid-sensing ion channel 2-like [Daphnia carinata]